MCGTAYADPTPLPLPPGLPVARDVSYPGHVVLDADATDLAHHLISVHERVPVASGTRDLVLLYPKWIPGDHGPTGPLALIAGIVVRANGAIVPWRRDPVATEAFHIAVPAGVSALDVDFQFTSPAAPNEGRVRSTPEMIDLAWNDIVLYPAGYFAGRIPVDASLKLPDGWHFGTALSPSTGAGGAVHFATVPLDVLIDSPVLAGRYFARFDLTPGAAPPVHLDVAADRPSELKASDAQLALHRALIVQATRLFGAHHYDHYDFLLALSDELGEEGLEHHRSSANAVGGDYFTAWDKTFYERDLLPHEYTHSWNGKYKRPADLWTPDYSTPERDTLLWVYEGQTQYWGQVLATRSGLWSRQAALDSFAYVAAYLQAERGRIWRSVEDTTASAIFQMRAPIPSPSWERGEDYYEEGQLVWLDADTLIRQKTGGRKSLDDFARAFFGADDGFYGERTYEFDDVVHTLNAVLPYDWAAFLHQRIDAVAPNAPLDGITRGGYRLVFDDRPSAWDKSADDVNDMHDFLFSIGVELKGVKLASVDWGSPGYAAGLQPEDEVVAVDGFAFDADGLADGLQDAITDAATSTKPIVLIVKSGSHVHTVSVDYHGGLRYPHLVRTGSGPALLDAILAAKP